MVADSSQLMHSKFQADRALFLASLKNTTVMSHDKYDMTSFS